MNFAKIFDSLDIDLDVKQRLSQNLTRIVEGSSDVYVTPLGKDHAPDEILRSFDKVFKRDESRMNSVLLDLEMSNRDKFGPRSKSLPWSERKFSLLESFETEIVGSRKLSPLKGESRLRPLTLQKALELLKNSTNSGLPYYTKKGKVKERTLLKFDSLLNKKYPCVLFTRTQEQKKTRDVWGYPIADTLNEMTFYSPLLAYQRKLYYRAALNNPSDINAKMTDLINRSIKTLSILVSIDFSGYDRTVKSILQALAFDYIMSCFQRKFHSKLDYIRTRFLGIGIVTPDGILSGNHGVPSGSTFTNEVDSIVQATIGMSNPFITEEDFQVQGDDGVYLVPEDKVEELLNSFSSSGLIVNKEKSYQANNYAIYLQNLYHVDYEVNGTICGIYPVYRALNRLVYQERWSDFEDYGLKGKDFYSIRAICILENCRYHPLFRELVEFIYKLDKYSLDASDQGVVRYVQMIYNTEGGEEILQHQYGDDIKGIKSFETVKLIKQLGSG